MSALDRRPTTLNFLSPLGFKFHIARSPDINYFVQSVTTPTMAIAETIVPTPFVRLPLQGDHIDFGQFSIDFKVDEQMVNYMDIYDWMMSIGFPDNFDQHRTLAYNKPETGNGLVSDATLIVMSSSMNPLKQFVFRNVWPVSLSAMRFDSRSSDITYIEATATFACQKFDIIPA